MKQSLLTIRTKLQKLTQNGWVKLITEKVTKNFIFNWSTAQEIKDDKETGNTMFVPTEAYETSVGVDDHAQQAKETLSLPHSTKDGVVSLTICDYGAIKHSLWKD